MSVGESEREHDRDHDFGLTLVLRSVEILCVGDHLYSDVLLSKRTLGWRTALIVPELEDEMIVFHETRDDTCCIRELQRLRDAINLHADGLRRRAAALSCLCHRPTPSADAVKRRFPSPRRTSD